MAHGFDHLDADDRVVTILDVAVVAHLYVDASRHAGAPGTLAGPRRLLLRQRERGDGRTSLRGAHRERAPAGADLEQPGAEPDAGGVEQRVDLAPLRIGQRLIGRHFVAVHGVGVEARARVGHGLVEELREEIVGQVVVTTDVVARTRLRVALGVRLVAHVEVTQALHPRGHQLVHARRERREHRGGVVGVPVAGHERLAEPDEPVATEPAEEVVAAHPHERRIRAATADDPSVGERDPHVERRHDPVEEGAGDGGVHRRLHRRGAELLPRTSGRRERRRRGSDIGAGHAVTPSWTGAAGRGITGRCFNQRRIPCKRISAITRRPAAG